MDANTVQPMEIVWKNHEKFLKTCIIYMYAKYVIVINNAIVDDILNYF